MDLLLCSETEPTLQPHPLEDLLAHALCLGFNPSWFTWNIGFLLAALNPRLWTLVICSAHMPLLGEPSFLMGFWIL